MKTTNRTTILLLGFLCIFVTIVLVGCGSSKDSLSSIEYEEPVAEEGMSDVASEAEEPVAESAGAPLTENMPVDNRKFIKNLDVDMQTKDFDKTTSSIATMVTEIGGYIEQSNISGNSLNYESDYSGDAYNPRSADYVLRIPVDKLDTVADKLSTLGNVTNRSERVEDVTANYADIERRLETLRVQEERLLAILKKADELEYIITLEKELSEVRYEIESYTINLKGLDNKISYSFVNIRVSEVIEYDDVRVAPPTFGTRIANGFSTSIRAIAEFGQALAVVLVTIIPFLVVWGGIITLLIIGIIKCKKAYRKKHPKVSHTQTEPEPMPKVEQEK